MKKEKKWNYNKFDVFINHLMIFFVKFNKKVEDFLYPIDRKINAIIDFIDCIPGNIKNIIYWFKIMYNDRNYDQIYLYIILHHKLKRMEKYFTRIGHDKTAGEISRCVYLIQRIMDDDLCREEFKKHEEKWGNLTITSEANGNGTFTLSSFKLHVTTAEEKELERKEFMDIVNLEAKRKDNAKRALFNIMKKNIDTWWD